MRTINDARREQNDWKEACKFPRGTRGWIASHPPVWGECADNIEILERNERGAIKRGAVDFSAITQAIAKWQAKKEISVAVWDIT